MILVGRPHVWATQLVAPAAGRRARPAVGTPGGGHVEDVPPAVVLTNGRSYGAAPFSHGLQEAVDCPSADLDAVDDPRLDRLPEMEPNEDA